MRHFIGHGLAFLTLVAVTACLWNSQFATCPGISLTLPEPSPAVPAPGAGHSHTLSADLPGKLDDSRLHLNFSLAAIALDPGEADWQAGRLHLEWLTEKGEVIRRDHLGTCRHNELLGPVSIVMKPPLHAHQVRIDIDNWGKSGHCQLLAFHAQSVKQQGIARAALAALIVGWVIWASLVLGEWRPNHLMAGLIWVIVAWNTILPGPWTNQLPLFTDFNGIQSSHYVDRLPTSLFQAASPRPPKVEIPNPLLRWKQKLKALRPLLHGILLFFPTLFLLLFVSKPKAATLMGLIATLIETSQWAFGFGFDHQDILDLTTDAIGIVSAIGFSRVVENLPLVRKMAQLLSNRPN